MHPVMKMLSISRHAETALSMQFPAGDFFFFLCVSTSSRWLIKRITGLAVQVYTAGTETTQALFQREYEKSVSNQDLFT